MSSKSPCVTLNSASPLKPNKMLDGTKTFKSTYELLTHQHMYDTSIIPNTPEQQTALFKSLISVVSEAKDIHADSENPFHKSRYASLAAHLSALKGLFKKHNLAVIQLPIGGEGMVGVRTIVVHENGGSISSDAFVPADKGMNGQQAGALYSYIRRYALAAVAGCATEDDDAESDRAAKPSSSYQKPQQAASTTKGTGVFSAKPVVIENASGAVAEALRFIIPFGKNKGKALGEIPKNSLDWYIKEYQPQPFRGEIKDSDLAFRQALDTIRDADKKPSQSAEEPKDEVPF